VSLRVIVGSLQAQSAGLSFQCDHDGKRVNSGVASNVSRDLLAFHRFETAGDDPVRALLPEIERLANDKSDAGRFEENGTLVIREVDLLRYGFQAKCAAYSQSADVTTNPSNDFELPIAVAALATGKPEAQPA
jgi:hypothetical protein